MKLETLKQRITENVKGKYTFEIQPLNTLNWKLTRIICYCPKHNHKWETAVTSPLYRGSGCPICAKEITASKKRTSIPRL